MTLSDSTCVVGGSHEALVTLPLHCKSPKGFERMGLAVKRAAYLTLLASSMVHSAHLRGPTDHHELLQLLPDNVIAATCATRPTIADAHGHSVPLVSPEVIQHIRDTMDLWGVRGVSLAVVRRRNDSDGFDVETHAFGTRDRNGTPMTTDVRRVAPNMRSSAHVL